MDRLAAGKQAVLEVLERVTRAASLPFAELGIQWISKGSHLTLVVRWGDESIKLGFEREDIEAWPSGDIVPDQYRDRIDLVVGWLMGAQFREAPKKDGPTRANG
jgi:hypothetical protein